MAENDVLAKGGMMSGLNKVMVIGNLGSNPEMRFTPSGSPVTSFRLASSRGFKDGSGQAQQETEWFSVVCWNKLAESCNDHLAKGAKVYVEGRLHTNSWDGPDGQRKYRTEIVANTVLFLDRRGAEKGAEGATIDGEELPF